MYRLDISQGPINQILSDLDPRLMSLQVKRSKLFLQITPFKISQRVRQKITSSLFKILNIFMAVGLTVSKVDGGQRSQGSGHYEIDYNSLKMQQTPIELCYLIIRNAEDSLVEIESCDRHYRCILLPLHAHGCNMNVNSAFFTSYCTTDSYA